MCGAWSSLFLVCCLRVCVLVICLLACLSVACNVLAWLIAVVCRVLFVV